MGEAFAVAAKLIWKPVDRNPDIWYCQTEFGKYRISLDQDGATATLEPIRKVVVIDGIEFDMSSLDICSGTIDETRTACAEDYRIRRASMHRDWLI